jgi:hypothetical protein
MSAAVDVVLERLEKVKRSGAGFVACCPAHEDRTASLAIHEGDDGRVLIHCHAGCGTGEIVAAIGLQLRDLFPEREAGGGGSYIPPKRHATAQHPGCTLAEYAQAKRLPEDFLKGMGVAQMSYLGAQAVRLPYLGTDGATDAVRIRVSLDGDDKFRWPRGTKARGKLYGLSRLSLARELDYLLLVEGESDAQTALFHGFPAIGLPGVGMWDETRNAEQLDGLSAIYAVVEPDRGGEQMLEWLTGSAIRERTRLVRLGDVKDLSELHIADPERFSERLELALQQATPWGEHERVISDLRRHQAWTTCRELAQARSLLTRFGADLRRAGVVGEKRSAKILFLVLTTRLFPRPASVVVKGPSSGGKSYLVDSVLRFFPPSAFHELTGMSEHALAYSTEPLRHRHLVLYEAAATGNAEFADYLMRSLLSEGRIRYETVEKTAGGLQARVVEREGPTGLVITTTQVALHSENETRMLSLTVSDTREQTRRVLHTLALEDDRPDVDLTAWHALQTWLAGGDCRVVIPYARELADLVPPNAVRLRRDFAAVLTLVKAHALLHQETRARDDAGRIVATLDDYRVVRGLVADLVAAGVEATVPVIVRETVEAVHVFGDEGVSLAALAEKLGLDKSSVSRRWREARRRGYLRNLEERRGHKARLVADEPLPEDVDVLPTATALERCCTVARNTEGDKDPPPPPERKEAQILADGQALVDADETRSIDEESDVRDRGV